MPIGPCAGEKTEFTKTTTARVYVRYLHKGVKAGDPATDYLIVATYPFPDPYDALRALAGMAAAASVNLSAGH